jgi:hypothetical protein
MRWLPWAVYRYNPLDTDALSIGPASPGRKRSERTMQLCRASPEFIDYDLHYLLTNN